MAPLAGVLSDATRLSADVSIFIGVALARAVASILGARQAPIIVCDLHNTHTKKRGIVKIMNVWQRGGP